MNINLIFKVCLLHNKQRLDVFLKEKILQLSRTQIKKLIICNKVQINYNIINTPKKKFF
ncbi:RNA-binding S4 domain-containing protein [Enterobacteriaceae endosymbiont of Donacia piscatrix]|uniref:RNA-binding S4 domain-containing protein n=1 Tax=Enterobacteriaceae endosymbiont of Donacia piscatrix TaxID=2675780 RepID=UPI0014493E77|nr:S4 domain-containing protein [Enterobacteriaceae endosymbiont of Donacia piscatrix]QJC35019.1 hypothetical protein GJT96_01905 [Enterobacteriaceae endosymbiont of Donacia piscatrix]